MKRTPLPKAVLLPAAALLAALFAAACGVSSADSVSANAVDPGGTSYDYSGRYVPVEGATNILTGATNGYCLSHLVLFQKGMSLDGRDSEGQHWSGAISSIASGGNAHFSLAGHMKNGIAVDIVGTLSYDGGTGLMSASWIEPDNVGSVYATASVSSTTNVPPSSTLTVSPSSATLARSATHTFTASGGTSPYTWSVSGGGTINRTTGSSVVYTAPATGGSAILTVSDDAGHSAVADIDIESASTNSINITSTLSVSPTSASLSPSESQTFSASGGKSPYTWRVSGGGSINRSTGSSVVYTAPATPGDASLTVSDSDSHSATATITVGE